jgi:GTP-binding protein
MLPQDERDEKRVAFLREFGWDAPSFCISALSGEGCQALVYAIMEYIEGQRAQQTEQTQEPYPE